MIFFRVFNYFSRVALLEFCRFRYSEFAYDFIPSLYEYSKKGASLTHHSRYPDPDLALSHSIAGIGVLRVLFGVDLGLALWLVEVLPLKINRAMRNGAVRSSRFGLVALHRRHRPSQASV